MIFLIDTLKSNKKVIIENFALIFVSILVGIIVSFVAQIFIILLKPLDAASDQVRPTLQDLEDPKKHLLRLQIPLP